jgi:hypothetical protein
MEKNNGIQEVISSILFTSTRIFQGLRRDTESFVFAQGSLEPKKQEDFDTFCIFLI